MTTDPVRNPQGDGRLIGRRRCSSCPPWVVGYTDVTGAAWTSWLVGVVVVVVSLTVVRASGDWGSRQAIQH
jgi:hypothetical protein